MSDKRKTLFHDLRGQMPSVFASLTPKEAKILRDRFGLSLENQPADDVDERTLRDLARKLVTRKKRL